MDQDWIKCDRNVSAIFETTVIEIKDLIKMIKHFDTFVLLYCNMLTIGI